MAKETANARAWYGADSGLWVTLPGQPVPPLPGPMYEENTFSPPGEGWYELGWLSEDGPTQGRSRTVERFRAWQGHTLVRTAVTEDDHTFQVQALEDNWVVQQLRYPSSPMTTAAGLTTTVVTPQRGEDVRSGVLDLSDGDTWKRIFVPRLVVDEMGDTSFTAGELTMYELTLLARPHVMTVGDYTGPVTLIEVTNAAGMVQPTGGEGPEAMVLAKASATRRPTADRPTVA
ncbi:phage tail tube protein [Streptomyces bohaiensis]|uniref:Uncharacterized protein n=1 Tax=Streptomyces bohaiensis TaxID=1431344 RepID=A0ABX1C4T5_9ACTN|nr:hypothetical protein [Streptomyces bohaiensis]NJQ14226.1 hypothetical protein [Streptomyces bohaiensis]